MYKLLRIKLKGPEITPNIYGQLISRNKGPRQSNQERMIFSTNEAGTACKRIKLNLYLRLFTKINPKWIDLNIRDNIV